MGDYHWTDDEQALLVSAAKAGKTASYIAKRLGKTKNAVIGRANRQGIALLYPANQKWSDDKRAMLQALRLQRYPMHEIARRMGVPFGTLKTYCQRHKIRTYGKPGPVPSKKREGR